MVVDDEAAPYNSNSAAKRGEDSTSGGRHEDGNEDATASRASHQDNVPAVEFDRSEGEMIVYHISSLSHADSRKGVTQFGESRVACGVRSRNIASLQTVVRACCMIPTETA